jgi:peroxiredoxin
LLISFLAYLRAKKFIAFFAMTFSNSAKTLSLFNWMFVLTLVSIQTLAQKPGPKPTGHDIRFKVNGYKDSTCIIAHYYGDNQYIPKDTAKFDSKGNLQFKGKKELPEGVYLLVLPKNKYVEFLVGEQFQSLEFDSNDAIGTMKIKEGKENVVFYDYQRLMAYKNKEASPIRQALGKTKNPDSTASLKKKLEAIDKEVKVFREKLFRENPGSLAVKLFKAAQDPEVPEAPILSNGRKDSLFQFRYYKAHYFDNMDLDDDRMMRTPLFHNKLEQFITKMTLQIPDSINHSADFVLAKAKSKEIFKYVVWWVTNHYEKSQIMGMDAVFVHMAKNYYLNGKAYWVDSATVNKIRERAKILEPILIGKKAPNMFLTDSAGKLITLDGFKSKATILYFWDPNCGHCQKETPKLHEFWEKYKQKGVGVYAVSIDRKPDDWKKYVREKGLKWTNVWDSYVATDFKNIYDIYSTPVIYILDENKRILAKRIGAEQLPDFFDNFFKDKIGGATRE